MMFGMKAGALHFTLHADHRQWRPYRKHVGADRRWVIAMHPVDHAFVPTPSPRPVLPESRLSPRVALSVGSKLFATACFREVIKQFQICLRVSPTSSRIQLDTGKVATTLAQKRLRHRWVPVATDSVPTKRPLNGFRCVGLMVLSETGGVDFICPLAAGEYGIDPASLFLQ